MSILDKYVCEHGSFKRLKCCKICDYPSYEVNKEIVFSTAHITEDTVAGLLTGDFSLLVTDTEHAWRIYVGESVNLDDVGCLNELGDLIKIAKNEGCIWLVLDDSGPVCDNLPVFEW